MTDWEELVASPQLDAVSIVTPTGLHYPMALAALRAGKHVLLEKPFALDAKEAKDLVDAARESGKTAMIAHEFRFASARMRAKELIEEGYLGDLRLALVRLFRDPGPEGPPPAFRGEQDMASGALGFLYSPRLALHRRPPLPLRRGAGGFGRGDHLPAGAPPRRRTREGRRRGHLPLPPLLRLGGGIAEMVASRETPFGEASTIEMYGSAGTLLTPQQGMNPPAHGTLIGARRGEAALAPLEIPERLQPFVDDRHDRLMPFRLLTREFLRGIEEGSSPSPSFDDAYACQQIIDAIRQSSDSGERVEIGLR